MNTALRLLDVNVLLPLLWPPHANHHLAQDWFARIRDSGWATCPITELGCVRVLAAAALSQGTLTVETAAGRLGEILLEPHHVFWPDDLQLSDSRFAASLAHVQGASQVTDRYLLALAAAREATFATFDRSVGSGLPSSSALLSHVEVIE